MTKLPKIPSAGLLPSEMPNLRGLLYGWGGRYLPHSYMLGLTLVVSAALFLWICYLLRKERDGSTAFALAMIGSMLLSYYLHIHDLTALLLPIALMAARTRFGFSAIVSACFILPVVLVFCAWCTNTLPFGYSVDWARRNHPRCDCKELRIQCNLLPFGRRCAGSGPCLKGSSVARGQ